jgi:leucyl/phenylalanyl-tRNA--protein transferase
MIEPDFLMQAYRMGIFPMAMDDGEIGWFSPDPRGIIPLDTFHIPKNLGRLLKKNPFEIRVDTAFEEVMKGCADRTETWIDERVMESYGELFRRGCAHSVESWFEGELAGGLYGVAIGGAFFGESMFHRRTDASKVSLVYLVEHLRKRRFRLLDTQWTTPNLRRFGARDVPKARYMEMLGDALRVRTSF